MTLQTDAINDARRGFHRKATRVRNCRLPNLTDLTITVVRTLQAYPDRSFTVRELVERTGASDFGVRRLLARLVTVGWVAKDPYEPRAALTDPQHVYVLTEKGTAQAARALGPLNGPAPKPRDATGRGSHG